MKLRIAVPDRVRNLRPAAPGPAAPGTAPSGGSIQQRLRGAAPEIATFVLAAAIAAQLAVLVMKFVAPPAPVAPVAGPAGPPRSTFDPGRLQSANVFGRAEPAPGDPGSAPRTNVALVLVGTIATSQPEGGLAILGESAQAARVYAVGSTLPGGVKLHSVYPDRVVIDRGGALETLPLPRQMAAGTAVQGSAQATVAPGGGGAAAAYGIPQAGSVGEGVQRLIASGPEVIGEMVRPMPDFANGQLRGFRLYPGRDRQKFARLGLQPGDLVTQVNGVPLGDAQRGMEILRGLGNAGQATVTVERGGSVQQVTVNAAQVEAMAAPAQPAPGQPAPGGAPTTPSEE